MTSSFDTAARRVSAKTDGRGLRRVCLNHTGFDLFHTMIERVECPRTSREVLLVVSRLASEAVHLGRLRMLCLH